MNVFSNLTKATHVSLLKARAEYLTDHTEGRARVINDGRVAVDAQYGDGTYATLIARQSRELVALAKCNRRLLEA